MKNVAERLLRLLSTDASLGNRVVSTAHAVVVSNPEFPLVPEANLVHTIRLEEGMGVWDLLEEVEPRLAAAGTPWRHMVEDPCTRPADLGARLLEARFVARTRIGAVRSGAPEGKLHTGVELRGIADKSAWASFGELRRVIHSFDGKTGEQLDQFAGLGRRRSLSSNVRYYLALLRFEPVGHVGLLSAGRAGMVVDLAVRPDQRGHGIARTMLARMAAQSRQLGHDLTCVLHDDRPEAARLASTMGFEAAVRFVSYLAGGSDTVEIVAP
jgi:ribosomal protein S18 acetylase RimI-like enzyme